MNRFRKRAGRWRYLLLFLLVMVLLRSAWRSPEREADPRVELILPGVYQLRRVREDGSLELFLDEAGRRWFRLRLLGVEIVDTAGAVREQRNLFAEQPLRIRFDRRRLDEHQTLTAYVYAGPTLVCDELVRQGLARVATQESDAAPIVRQLEQAQAEAVSQRRGIWGD
jgi:hypothetical protein